MSTIDFQFADWIFLAVVAAISAMTCTVVVLTQRWHGRFSLDTDMSGAQKFHDHPVPRIGGIGLALGLLGGGAMLTQWSHLDPADDAETALLLLACGIPAFLAGLVEDMTKAVSVAKRLAATFVSAGMAVWLLDARLTDVDTFGLDTLMLWAPIAIAFTCFAVAGVANAVNIIDGFNGLAGGSVCIMFAGLGFLSWQMDDALVMHLCIIGGGATFGFLLLNYPHGRIFLGDGGAYLVGFWLAECAVLLLARNPELSTWTVLLVCIYPVFETVFSIWRKSIHRKTGAGKPDKVHFHMLVFRRLVCQMTGRQAPAWVKHGLTSLFIWTLVMACAGTAVAINAAELGTLASMAGIAAFVVCYVFIYRSLVIGTRPSMVDSAPQNEPNSVAN